MSQRPFRFLHAADLRLDEPVGGVPDAPGELLDLLIDCPLRAAERMFDAAISHRVDFVLLAGNVIDAKWAAPREWLFLLAQFERLAQHKIAVYWAGGATDSLTRWPDFVHWPANVHCFPGGRIGRHPHEVAGATVCEIVGASHDESGPPKAYEFCPATPGAFTVAVANASWNCSGLQEIGVNYWALGGSHGRSTPLESGCVAHFAGTLQGRSAAETGPHGWTIVSVNEHSRTQLTPEDCDLVRWQSPRLSVANSTDGDRLVELLHQRTEQLRTESPNVAHLVTWRIECGPALRAAMRRGELVKNLLAGLRAEFGHRSPPWWTVGVEAEWPQNIPSVWYDEDTIRGDFLREIRSAVSEDASGAIQGIRQELDDCGGGAGAAASLTPSGIEELLDDAAWLGADLLSPQEAAS